MRHLVRRLCTLQIILCICAGGISAGEPVTLYSKILTIDHTKYEERVIELLFVPGSDMDLLKKKYQSIAWGPEVLRVELSTANRKLSVPPSIAWNTNIKEEQPYL